MSAAPKIFGYPQNTPITPSKGQKRTSFDDVIGTREQPRWDSEAQCLGRSKIDCQFKLGRQLNGEIAGLFAFQYPRDVNSCAAIRVWDTGAVTH
jgi:hypothetical protein